MFNYSWFFNLAKLNIDYISIVSIKNTIKVLDISALFYTALRDIVEKDDLDNTIKVYSSSIDESIAEATLKKKEVFLDKKEMTQ
jgi:hypothetical protein